MPVLLVVLQFFRWYNRTKSIFNESQEAYVMKRQYEEPIVLLVSIKQEDIVTASPTKGDNMLDDSFFDWDKEVWHESFISNEKINHFRMRDCLWRILLEYRCNAKCGDAG